MRLFGVWNRTYKCKYIVAETIEEALTLAAQSGHIKRAQQYRKWQDLTDSPPPGVAKFLGDATPGVLTESAEGFAMTFTAADYKPPKRGKRR